MTWTDERIERLRKLWEEGLSASQIAADLGGISRNAVIGKIHRLGLSGRVKAPTPQRRGRKQRLVAKPVYRAPRRTVIGNTVLKTIARPEPQAVARTEPEPAPAAEAEIVPLREPVGLLDLREQHCRWPIGDPAEPGFRFCGQPSPIGQPYCAAHARRAYQAPLPRKAGGSGSGNR